MAIRLPRPGHLPKTGPVDWVDRYHSRGIGLVLRRRLTWVLEALGNRPLDRVLEIGAGSGVFQYELAARARVSVALDVHELLPIVRRKLAEDGVSSVPVRADGGHLPFRNAAFDAVVVVSALEFVPSPAACLAECRRVLRPGGRLICLIPRELQWADALFKTLTGRDPEEEFAGGRRRVREAVGTMLPDAERRRRPMGFGPIAPYEVVVAAV